VTLLLVSAYALSSPVPTQLLVSTTSRAQNGPTKRTEALPGRSAAPCIASLSSSTAAASASPLFWPRRMHAPHDVVRLKVRSGTPSPAASSACGCVVANLSYWTFCHDSTNDSFFSLTKPGAVAASSPASRVSQP